VIGKEQMREYGRNMKGELIELPSVMRAVELATGIETYTARFAGQAVSATCYAGPESCTRIELGPRILEHRGR
jgi:hypothetical protein